MPQAAAVLWSQWEKFHSHAVGRGLRDSRYLRSALNRIPTSQISHLSCDSTDALLGKIACLHFAHRYFIPRETLAGGLIGWQGLTLFGIYVFGMLAGLTVAGLVNRFTPPQEQMPFMMEMPAYRVPALVPIARKSVQRAQHFVTKAGLVILSVTIVVWTLGYFPNQGADLGASWLGTLGQWIEPPFQPLGLDWRYGVATVSAFLAREVFVGTLGTIMGIEGAEENIVPLVEQVQASALPIGSGLALMVFFAIALQCVSTVAILAKEAQSWRIAINMVIAYLLLAWLAAWVTFQVTTALV